ncbi:MAG: preprotein translocase subunit SecE [Zoogloeaceae bacterium]|jgi:preprotein translocase subunit SecE|nr:preprotein translocase subunit SecE [Zoogloeaceae bacterium]
MLEKLKFLLVFLLVAAGLAGYYLLGDYPVVVRIICVLAGVILGGLVFWRTPTGERFVTLCRESVVEAKKVVWPTKKETTQTTLAVFAFAVVMAVFLFLTDKTLEWVLYDLILGWKS